MTFSGTQKPIPPTVFNLQASDWVYCDEETGTHMGKSCLTLNWSLFLKQIFKVVYLAKKNPQISKNSTKIYYSFFFQKPIIGNTYIFTKFIDNFKFLYL